MAASHTLPQSFAIPQISKSGVLTLYGFGIRVTMQEAVRQNQPFRRHNHDQPRRKPQSDTVFAH